MSGSCDAAVRGAQVRLEIGRGPLRRDLAHRLRALGAEVVCAPDADAPPDLVVADRLPGHRTAPVMVLCAGGDAAERVAALRGGADEAVSRSAPAPLVIARIGALLRRIRRPGPTDVDGPILREGRLRLDPATGRARAGDREAHLTPRETALLALLMREPGRVVSHARILAAVWGERPHDDVNLVATYVRYIRRKLDTGDGPSVIRTVRGFGYAVRDS